MILLHEARCIPLHSVVVEWFVILEHVTASKVPSVVAQSRGIPTYPESFLPPCGPVLKHIVSWVASEGLFLGRAFAEQSLELPSRGSYLRQCDAFVVVAASAKFLTSSCKDSVHPHYT